MIARLLLALALSFLGLSDAALAKCNARFLNPLTEVCFDCIFPISVGSISLFGSRPDTPNRFATLAEPFSARASLN